MKLRKIRSGGQTGADRAGLVAGKLLGFEVGGTAPKGYRTLEGNDYDLRDIFGLEEHLSWAYPPRTEENVRKSDATIRIAAHFDSAGENCTLRFIKKHGKPFFDIDMNNPPPVERTAEWIINHNVEELNVAGNSEKSAPGIHKFAVNYLVQVFRIIKERSKTSQ